ncbi:hypothetical protein RIF29_15752 [Crotalaria pallida]|uniref:Uncharacterized protein n=1 Tax=Crotalaria pallida TaxID=3830 RepID=A0AAN9FG19_CROPI
MGWYPLEAEWLDLNDSSSDGGLVPISISMPVKWCLGSDSSCRFKNVILDLLDGKGDRVDEVPMIENLVVDFLKELYAKESARARDKLATANQYLSLD